jgi:hypothetical protein
VSSARNHVPPDKPTEEESAKVLREHMDDAKAETLARRYVNADEAAKTAVDWPTVKRRILNPNRKRQP